MIEWFRRSRPARALVERDADDMTTPARSTATAPLAIGRGSKWKHGGAIRGARHEN